MAKSSTRILLYMLKFMTADAATSPSSEEFHPPKTGTAEMLSAILEEVSPSHPVRDGDCDIVAARVTLLLSAAVAIGAVCRAGPW